MPIKDKRIRLKTQTKLAGIIKVGGRCKTWKYSIVTGIETFVTYW